MRSNIGNENAEPITSRLRVRQRVRYSEIDYEDEQYVPPRQGRRRRRSRRVRRRRGSSSSARNSSSEAEQESSDSGTRRTVLSWMIDMGTISLNELVCHIGSYPAKLLGVGRIRRDGIFCLCCFKVFTVPEFQMHVVGRLQKPYLNTVTERGFSLLRCEVDAWELNEPSSNDGFQIIGQRSGDSDKFDDVCAICGDGGDMICCDNCPSTFHYKCMGYREIPIGKWRCPYCLCRLCGIHGDPELCSVKFLKCHHCEQKYHPSCKGRDDVAFDFKFPYVNFCRKSCRKLFEKLQRLLGCRQDLDSGYSWTLIRRFDQNSVTLVFDSERRALCNAKLSVALSVMNECFETIIDRRSGIDLTKSIVYNYGSNINRLNFSGFYTVILEKDDEIISVAAIRILETREAEMPYIGTRVMYRRQGMCRRLLDAIETLLGFCNVEKLVVPSVRERVTKWVQGFGFHPVDRYHQMGSRFINEVVFPNAIKLQKLIPNQEFAEENVADGVGASNAGGIQMAEENSRAGVADNASSSTPLDLNHQPANGVGLNNAGNSANQSQCVNYRLHQFMSLT